MLSNIGILIDLPPFNIGLIVNGLLAGGVFALAAYGLALVWGVMNVKNLAQGEFVIMGGYVAWWGARMTDLNPIIFLPVAAILMFAFGWVTYILIIRRVLEKDMFTSLLSTFGLAIVIQQGLNLAFGPEVRVAESDMGTLRLMQVNQILYIKFVAFGLCLLLAAAIVSFMKYSRMGQAIRATAQDPRAAKVMGINTDRVYAFTYALNAAICGAAGVLISMILVLQPFYGVIHSVRSFVIVTAAGIGNLPGVIFASLGLGVVEQYSGFVLGAEFQVAIVVIMLILVLVWRQIQAARVRQVVQ
ncbi:MAG: branched-chain amino acid ABC transporter permease [Alphaproteobacteria bacterium]